jgi:hypothetical protein
MQFKTGKTEKLVDAWNSNGKLAELFKSESRVLVGHFLLSTAWSLNLMLGPSLKPQQVPTLLMLSGMALGTKCTLNFKDFVFYKKECIATTKQII